MALSQDRINLKQHLKELLTKDAYIKETFLTLMILLENKRRPLLSEIREYALAVRHLPDGSMEYKVIKTKPQGEE